MNNFKFLAEVRGIVERDNLMMLDTSKYVSLDSNSQLAPNTVCVALSYDGRFFASAHGEFSVKVLEYPSCRQIASLDGHTRTLYTLLFHPRDFNIVV